MAVTKKKKHVSKKNKKDWRKHCDITDVEAFLEDQRLEERLGKFDTKPDDELFVVDTGGDLKDDKEEKPLSHKLRKRAKLNTTPKCFEILLPSSKVPDPNTKRNHVNPIGSKPTALSKLNDKRRVEKGVYKKKLEVARKNRQVALERKRKVKQTRQNISKDLWGGDLPESKSMPESLCGEFVSPEARLHNTLPDMRLRPRPPLPKTVASRTAVELPHPGVSYNPSFQEHQALLKDVVEHEQKMIKREKHLIRVTTDMFTRVTPEEKMKTYLKEMELSTPTNKNDGGSENETDNEYKAINPPVKNKKKDHKARRKQRERLMEAERLRRLKVEKKKITDLNKLRKLEAMINKKEKKAEQLKAKKVAKKEAKAETALPALNAHKVPRKEPDLVAPEELPDSLRHVSTSVNLLKERYESLQQRGVLAGSKPMMKKKRKLKSYFKPGHKVTEKDVERYVTRSQTQAIIVPTKGPVKKESKK